MRYLWCEPLRMDNAGLLAFLGAERPPASSAASILHGTGEGASGGPCVSWCLKRAGTSSLRFGLLVGSAAALVVLAAIGLYAALHTAERTLDAIGQPLGPARIVADRLDRREAELGQAAGQFGDQLRSGYGSDCSSAARRRWWCWRRSASTRRSTPPSAAARAGPDCRRPPRSPRGRTRSGGRTIRRSAPGAPARSMTASAARSPAPAASSTAPSTPRAPGRSPACGRPGLSPTASIAARPNSVRRPDNSAISSRRTCASSVRAAGQRPQRGRPGLGRGR
jgi:hypothetical protein